LTAGSVARIDSGEGRVRTLPSLQSIRDNVIAAITNEVVVTAFTIVVTISTIVFGSTTAHFYNQLNKNKCDAALATAEASFKKVEVDFIAEGLSTLKADSKPMGDLRALTSGHVADDLARCAQGRDFSEGIKHLYQALLGITADDFEKAVTETQSANESSLKYLLRAAALDHEADKSRGNDSIQLRSRAEKAMGRVESELDREFGQSAFKGLFRVECDEYMMLRSPDADWEALGCWRIFLQKYPSDLIACYNIAALYSRSKNAQGYQSCLNSLDDCARRGASQEVTQRDLFRDPDFRDNILADRRYAEKSRRKVTGYFRP
jgi:hypothetical protein